MKENKHKKNELARISMMFSIQSYSCRRGPVRGGEGRGGGGENGRGRDRDIEIVRESCEIRCHKTGSEIVIQVGYHFIHYNSQCIDAGLLRL